ncbi:tail fiber protein [Hoeflea sp. YIM 152468]|uniref:phage tail protein n=1 Tax=Hoeflea sp. YIM 152468 TaxID=3031759 RepID=UPI0023DA2571|nr:tail fiber protein [Hoeflea sp. YIM 152468]MDF1606911.1 tail fiber protein [Hoeflea sp. YIM 152468]
MSEPFVAEIRIFAGNFAPRGWAFCDGQLLPVSQNTALFSLIGTAYGGDGRSTTALPNLQGRAPMHSGRGPGLTSRRLGQRGGVEMVTLSEAQMPNHTHTMRGNTNDSISGDPSANSFAFSDGGFAYSTTNTNTDLVDMADEALPNAGASQPHNNLQPYLTMNFIIALQGLYPSRG